MKPAALAVTPATRSAGTRRATITKVISGRRVELHCDDLTEPVTALIAAFGYDEPLVGDAVLAYTDDDDTYVIGVVRALRQAPTVEPTRHEVRDQEGRLLFRYDPTSGVSEVFVPVGDLKFRVAEGSLSFQARQGIVLESDEQLALRSQQSVVLNARVGEAPESGTILVEPGRIGVSAPELLAAAGRAQLAATRVGLVAEQLESTVTRVKQVVRVLETRAHRVMEHTIHSYREVERIAQLKAGRIRHVAQDSAQIFGKRLLLRSKKDTKIRGEKIQLA